MIAWANSEEENEKRLGSMLISGVPVMSLDNAETDIGGARKRNIPMAVRATLRY